MEFGVRKTVILVGRAVRNGGKWIDFSPFTQNLRVCPLGENTVEDMIFKGFLGTLEK